MNAAAIGIQELTCQLLDTAAGISVGTAELIISHGHFLHRDAFRRTITAGASICTGQPLATIGWDAALHALEAAPASVTPAIPVRLRTVLGTLDTRNLTLVTTAITTANG